MRNKLLILAALMSTALLGSGALAAQGTSNQATPNRAPTTARTQRTLQSLTTRYYSGDLLSGGQLLTFRTVTPQPGARPFADAPSGATYAVVEAPFGKRVIDLKNAPQVFGNPGMGGPRASVPGQEGDQAGERGKPEVGGLFAGAMRGASAVTFYDGDPLGGGKVTTTFKLTGAAAQGQALQQAAAKARFAVVETRGEKLVLDLSTAQAGAGPAPRS